METGLQTEDGSSSWDTITTSRLATGTKRGTVVSYRSVDREK